MAATANKKKKHSRKAPYSGKKLSEKALFSEKNPTFETVWASLQELGRMQKEDRRSLKETERIMKERAALLDKEIKETERIVKRNGKQMGELHRRFGQLAEHLVAPGITKRFTELGYHFDIVATKGAKLYDKNAKIKAEIDFYLENTEVTIVVEIKSRPVLHDIEHHEKRLELFREQMNLINKGDRKILGAIAGAIFEDDVKKAVSEAGMYVIEQSGDTMKIDVPDGFIPREW